MFVDVRLLNALILHTHYEINEKGIKATTRSNKSIKKYRTLTQLYRLYCQEKVEISVKK